MKLKIALASATALGLLVGSGALADDNNVANSVQSGTDNTASVSQEAGSGNKTMFTQIGENNSVDITQSGNSNQAANRVAPTTGTSSTNWMRQSGNDNAITILQESNSNQVTGEGGPGGKHFLQQGNNNTADITQRKGVGNYVHAVDQIDTTNGSTASNTLTILQEGADFNAYGPLGGGNYNYSHSYIRDVDQTFTGGAQNELKLTQSGGTFSAGNDMKVLRQYGAGNYGEVSQTGGRSNLLGRLDQEGTGNSAALTFQGGSNGTTAFTDLLDRNDASSVAGVTQSQVMQSGDNNTIGYAVVGANNSFGFTQDGGGNWINGTAEGDGHQIAILQLGDGNVTDFRQTGTGNNAGIEIVGSDNRLDVRQDQAGASGNNAWVGITGSNNNNYALNGNLGFNDGGPLTDAKAFAVNDLGGGSTSFEQGDLFQSGSNNSLMMSVSTNNNAFATYQAGDNNEISHTIEGGAGNRAIIAQIGNGNESVSTQSGGGNIVAVMQ